MPENAESKRFIYRCGALEAVITGGGSILSSIQYLKAVETIFTNIRKGSSIPVIGVCQPYYHEENKIGLRNAISEASQRIAERAYGFRDEMSPFLTALIYHPAINHPNEVINALPKRSQIKRVVLYPYTKMPKFDLKKDLTIQAEARNRLIFSCLTPESELYLKEHANVMEGVGKRYGLTLPEFIAREMIKPNSKILSIGEDKLLEQKTALAHLFLLLPVVNLDS